MRPVSLKNGEKKELFLFCSMYESARVRESKGKMIFTGKKWLFNDQLMIIGKERESLKWSINVLHERLVIFNISSGIFKTFARFCSWKLEAAWKITKRFRFVGCYKLGMKNSFSKMIILLFDHRCQITKLIYERIKNSLFITPMSFLKLTSTIRPFSDKLGRFSWKVEQLSWGRVVALLGLRWGWTGVMVGGSVGFSIFSRNAR